MTVWKHLAQTHRPSRRRKILWGFGVFLLSVGSGLAIWAPATAPAATRVRTGVSAHAKTMPATVIACFDKESGKFRDKTDPGNCDVAGYEGERGRNWVRTPVEGVRWEEWGTYKSRGIDGEDTRSGAEIRLYAYRRIKCGDGRTFYSEANVINLKTGNFFYVRLPICDDLTPKS
jgi:hypothetical protein